MNLWSAPLWALLLTTALVPLRMLPRFTIGDLFVSASDVGIVAVALFYAAVLLITPVPARRPTNWHRNLHLFGFATLVFAAISIRWSGLDRSDSLGMLYTLVLAASSLLLGYAIVATLPADLLDRLLLRLSLALAGFGAIYSAESLFALGLRSELGRSYSIGFGIERVMGPLFPASIGHVVMLPAAAFLVQDLVRTLRYRLAKIAALVALMVTLFGTGSRAAALLTALFTVTFLWIARKLRSGFVPVLLALASITAGAGIVFSVAQAGRLASLVDERRASARDTAWNAVTSRDAAQDLVGMGYGALWPWYIHDIDYEGLVSQGHDMASTQYGWTVYHPHSVLLLLGVELGAVGILFLLKLWTTLGVLFFRSLAGSPNAIFGCGVVITSLAMFGDLIIFKNFKTSWIWWLFVFAALSKTACRASASALPPSLRAANRVEHGVLVT